MDKGYLKSVIRSNQDLATYRQKIREMAGIMSRPAHLIPFLYQYSTWNGYFGSGVASLAGKIGRSRNLFLDPNEEYTCLQDRGVYIANYVFRAARDEFDDSGTPHIDTHRCLAQALMKGLFGYYHLQPEDTTAVCRVPVWLRSLNARVAIGYGAGSPDDLPCIFRAMGYHMGSEILAAGEFTELDRYYSTHLPELVQHLRDTTATINGQEHEPYYWIRVHSDLGSGVESDHFEDAVRAIEMAMGYVRGEDLQREMTLQVKEGFEDFANDHAEFFSRVGDLDAPYLPVRPLIAGPPTSF